MAEKFCLGIESTAHTFGCGVVSFDGKIFASEKAVYTTEKGGMIPNEVAKHHEEKKLEVLKKALDKSGLGIEQFDLISFSRGPGLAPCLLVGLRFAKELASKHNIPLIGVNHPAAHLTIGDLCCKTKDPVYLYVSGVNTQVIAVVGKKFRIFGETLDIGLGNALDKFGRDVGLGFPAGPKIEELAKKGSFVALPYAVKGMDVSFSGLVTYATRLVKDGKSAIEDVCYSFQEVAFAMLAEISERALAHCDKKELLLVGGVAANKRLITMLRDMCEARKARFEAVPLEFSGDNGAMIAWQGVLEHVSANRRDDYEKADINPYERIDEVEVTWR